MSERTTHNIIASTNIAMNALALEVPEAVHADIMARWREAADRLTELQTDNDGLTDALMEPEPPQPPPLIEIRGPALEIVEQACVVMHDAYERAAVLAGWETQTASRKPWEDVPEANKTTMRAAVLALMTWLNPHD